MTSIILMVGMFFGVLYVLVRVVCRLAYETFHESVAALEKKIAEYGGMAAAQIVELLQEETSAALAQARESESRLSKTVECGGVWLSATPLLSTDCCGTVSGQDESGGIDWHVELNRVRSEISVLEARESHLADDDPKTIQKETLAELRADLLYNRAWEARFAAVRRCLGVRIAT